MKQKTFIFLPLFFLAAAIIAVFFSVRWSQQRKQLRSKAAPATVLSIVLPSVTKQMNEAFSLSIQIDTGENQVVGVDLSLSFNPAVLEVVDILPGGFFSSPQQLAKNIDNQVGTIIYSLGSFIANQGSGTIALISIKAKGEGISTLNFNPETSVAGVGEAEALQSTISGIITVLGVIPTATPTLVPPTSTPIPPTPTLIPTAIPTIVSPIQPIATSVPTVAPTLTPTPTLSLITQMPFIPGEPTEIPATPTLVRFDYAKFEQESNRYIFLLTTLIGTAGVIFVFLIKLMFKMKTL